MRSLRGIIRRVIPKKTRNNLIKIFVKHRYWYAQGNNVLASTAVISVEKIIIGIAAIKYITSEEVPVWIIVIVLMVYFTWRILSRWSIGYFWEDNEGYDIEAEWNKVRVPPNRFYMVNIDELAKKVAEELKQ